MLRLEMGWLRVWQRNMLTWRRFFKAHLVGALGEPILYLLGIGYGLGKMVPAIQGVRYVEFIAPGLLASAIMNTATFETTFGSFTRMKEQKTYEGIIMTPVSVGHVVAGDILFAATKCLLDGIMILLIMVILGLVKSLWALLLIPLIPFTGIMFGSMGMMITARSPSYDFFTYYYTLVISFMFIFSGIFFPISSLPVWAQSFSWFLPLTHAVNLARSLTSGDMSLSLLDDLLWIVVFASLSFLCAVRMIKRRIIV
jgi:lipooligosaccharide transport system permease protein